MKVHICPDGTLWDLRDFKLMGAAVGIALVANMGSADDKKRFKLIKKQIDKIIKSLRQRAKEKGEQP